MGPTSRFTAEDIHRMRRLREHGASLGEIIDILRSNEKAVFYYVGDIQPSKDGHQIEVIKKALWQWAPNLLGKMKAVPCQDGLFDI